MPLRRVRCATRTKEETTMSIQLPVPIEHYVQIANSGTPDAVPECFAADATVHDEGQTYKEETTMSIQLPVPIEHYVQIANSGTPDAVPECFAADATVHDEGQTYKGV